MYKQEFNGQGFYIESDFYQHLLQLKRMEVEGGRNPLKKHGISVDGHTDTFMSYKFF